MASAATEVGLREATRRGLQREPKELPTIWLYDERGSQLYEQITRLPDYYLPRREREILHARVARDRGADAGAHARRARFGKREAARVCCSTRSRRRSSASSRST